MKKLLIVTIILILFTSAAFGAPDDILDDHINAIWLITAKTDMLDILLTSMNAMPQGFRSIHNQNEWAIWLKLEIAINPAKFFPPQVYTDVLNKIIGYNYETAEIADEYKAPENIQVTTGQITCDEDPTGESRTVLLYKRVGLIFTEQAITGNLDAGTWTFSSVPTGSNYVLAYSDNFQSFPTEYITVP